MRTNKDYILRKIAGEHVLLPTGAASERLNGMITLTSTAAYIWEQVDTAKDLTEMILLLEKEFDVDAEKAKQDVYGFLWELYQREMVYDIPQFQQEDWNGQLDV